MSGIRGTSDYTTQLPPTPAVGGAAPTSTVTGPTPTTADVTDSVDAPPVRGTSSTALGLPRVTGGTAYDQTLGATTLQDVGTVSDILASTASTSDMATLLAKLLIAFNSTDKDATQQLIEAAMDRQKAEQENEANKVVQLAELMDAASGPSCLARQRTEDKLLEMGYSPEQAHAIAKQMTDKHTTPGQQAILALAAVEAAPGNQKAGAGGDAGNPMGLEDPTAAQRKAAAQQADSEAAMLLLMLLLASRSHAVEGGLAATGQRPAQPVTTGAPPAGAPAA